MEAIIAIFSGGCLKLVQNGGNYSHKSFSIRVWHGLVLVCLCAWVRMRYALLRLHVWIFFFQSEEKDNCPYGIS